MYAKFKEKGEKIKVMIDKEKIQNKLEEYGIINKPNKISDIGTEGNSDTYVIEYDTLNKLDKIKSLLEKQEDKLEYIDEKSNITADGYKVVYIDDLFEYDLFGDLKDGTQNKLVISNAPRKDNEDNE